jgi:hypothetical protein
LRFQQSATVSRQEANDFLRLLIESGLVEKVRGTSTAHNLPTNL